MLPLPSPPMGASPDIPYHQFRTLVAAPRSARAIAIGSRPSPLAATALERRGLTGLAPSTPRDRYLFEAGGADDDRGALLCLRCRVSHAAVQRIEALYRQFGSSHQLDLIDMAATVLDDQGAPLPWPQADQPPAGHRPFALEVIESFRPELAGLGQWTRVRVQSHGALAQLLREHGLLLIRDWALLAHSSPTRMERAWRSHGQAALDLTSVRRLHQSFRRHYSQAMADLVSRRRRWEPNIAFLERLDPAVAADVTRRRLQALASALRRERLDPLTAPKQEYLEAELAPGDGAGADGHAPPPERIGLLERTLRRALAQQLPAMLAATGAEAALRACLWRHYALGLRQREISEACGCCQAKVSRRLQPSAHAGVIATTALTQLAGQEGFEAVGGCLKATETQVAALRDYLLGCPVATDRPRLALWLAPLLAAIPPVPPLSP